MVRSKALKLEFLSKEKKFKKYHLSKIKLKIQWPSYHTFGYVLGYSHYMSAKQISKVMKILKKWLKFFNPFAVVKVFPIFDILLTKKPKDIRMGRGKGLPCIRVGKQRRGLFLYGDGLSYEMAFRLIKIVSKKLPDYRGRFYYFPEW